MLGAKLLLPLFKPFQEPDPEPVQDVHADTITTVSGKKIPVAGTEKNAAAGQKTGESGMPEHLADNEEDLRFRLSDDDLDSMDDLKKLDGV